MSMKSASSPAGRSQRLGDGSLRVAGRGRQRVVIRSFAADRAPFRPTSRTSAKDPSSTQRTHPKSLKRFESYATAREIRIADSAVPSANPRSRSVSDIIAWRMTCGSGTSRACWPRLIPWRACSGSTTSLGFPAFPVFTRLRERRGVARWTPPTNESIEYTTLEHLCSRLIDDADASARSERPAMQISAR